VAAASAGLYASLHLITLRWHLVTQFFTGQMPFLPSFLATFEITDITPELRLNLLWARQPVDYHRLPHSSGM